MSSNEDRWEMFHDYTYFEMWCVRDKNDRDFNSPTSFHFVKKEDAETLIDLLRRAK